MKHRDSRDYPVYSILSDAFANYDALPEQCMKNGSPAQRRGRFSLQISRNRYMRCVPARRMCLMQYPFCGTQRS